MFEEGELTRVDHIEANVAEMRRMGDSEVTVDNFAQDLAALSGEPADDFKGWAYPMDEYANVSDANIKPAGINTVVVRLINDRVYVSKFDVYYDTMTGRWYVKSEELW